MPDGASALQLVFGGDPGLYRIVALSLYVSFSAVLLAALVALPFGAFLALVKFPGRTAIIVVINAFMGLPPVVVGLAVYLLLSRSGPLGFLGILFSPKAMIIAQALLVMPIIAALTRQTIEDLWAEYREELTALRVKPARRVGTLLWDARFALVTTLLAGFGRAAAEVGTVMIVGGNIDGFTRTMTTAIALETSKGDLPLAMGLGMVLVTIVIGVNALAWSARRVGELRAGSWNDARTDHRPAACLRQRLAAHRQRRHRRQSQPRNPSRCADDPARPQRVGQKHAAAPCDEPDTADLRPRDLGAARAARRAPRDGVPAARDAAPERGGECRLCAQPERSRARERVCWRRSASRILPTVRHGASPAASSSGSPWRARSRAIRRSCFSTSRPRASIPPPQKPSKTSSRRLRRPA